MLNVKKHQKARKILKETLRLAKDGNLVCFEFCRRVLRYPDFQPCVELASEMQFSIGSALQCGLPTPKDLCKYCAINGYFEFLEWLKLTDKCRLDRETLSAASGEGNIKMMRWLIENGCPMSKSATEAAASGGHFKALVWLRKRDCPWDARTCSQLAKGGHFKTLKWAHDNGCKLDHMTAVCAVQSGILDIVKWTMQHYKIDKNSCSAQLMICRAAWDGHLSILQYLRDKFGPAMDETICEKAASDGRQHILDWMRSQGCPLYKSTFFIAFDCAKNYELCRWLLKVGCPMDEQQMGQVAACGFFNDLLPSIEPNKG